MFDAWVVWCVAPNFRAHTMPVFDTKAHDFGSENTFNENDDKDTASWFPLPSSVTTCFRLNVRCLVVVYRS